MFRKYVAAKKADDAKKLNAWDEANLLQNMKNENVHVSTVANQRYVYREHWCGSGDMGWLRRLSAGLIAHSELK